MYPCGSSVYLTLWTPAREVKTHPHQELLVGGRRWREIPRLNCYVRMGSRAYGVKSFVDTSPPRWEARSVARPLRIEYPGAVYHVLNRRAARQKVFRGAVDYQRFWEGLAEAHTRWGVELFAFCLMGTHYHLCLRTPGGNLGRIMRHVDGLYTQRFNRAHSRDGPLFRGRYQAILVEADLTSGATAPFCKSGSGQRVSAYNSVTPRVRSADGGVAG